MGELTNRNSRGKGNAMKWILPFGLLAIVAGLMLFLSGRKNKVLHNGTNGTDAAPVEVVDSIRNAESAENGGNIEPDSAMDLDPESPYWYDKEQTEVYFSKNKDTLICFPRIKAGGDYTVPSSVRCIAERAFLGCRNLTSVTIPKSVRSIGMAAFESCDQLKRVDIHASIDTMPFRCFTWCKDLKELHLTNKKPPVINEEFELIFGDVDTNTCIIFVPKGAVPRYRKDAEWKRFKRIREEKGKTREF